MAIFWLWLSLAIHSAFASPFFNWNAAQQTLGKSNTNLIRVGWYDPRLNGGRFLDVRYIIL
jgi:hypothetical protein